MLGECEVPEPWVPACPTELVRGLKAHGTARVGIADFHLDLDTFPSILGVAVCCDHITNRFFVNLINAFLARVRGPTGERAGGAALTI